MIKSKKYSYPPPHVGWWRVFLSGYREVNSYCWWNGSYWSRVCLSSDNLMVIKRDSGIKSSKNIIYWIYEWPKNARIARINPKTGEVTGAGPAPGDKRVTLKVGQTWFINPTEEP